MRTLSKLIATVGLAILITTGTAIAHPAQNNIPVISPILSSLISQAHADTEGYLDPVQAFHELNSLRAHAGVDPVQWDSQLGTDAEQWSQHMADTGRSEHDSHDTVGWFAGENIFWTTEDPQECIDAWRSSPEHYRTMINPEFTHVGFASVTADDDTFYVTQRFA